MAEAWYTPPPNQPPGVAMKLSEEDQEVLEYWKKGWTGGQIAKKLYMTRNAVMGKLYRWRKTGVIDYKTSETRKAAVKQSVRIANRKEALGKGIPRQRVKHELPLINFLEALPPPPPLTEPVKFMDLTMDSCRFVVSGGVAKDFRFCNHPKLANSSYCKDHHYICYVPKSSIRELRAKTNDASA